MAFSSFYIEILMTRLMLLSTWTHIAHPKFDFNIFKLFFDISLFFFTFWLLDKQSAILIELAYVFYWFLFLKYVCCSTLDIFLMVALVLSFFEIWTLIGFSHVINKSNKLTDVSMYWSIFFRSIFAIYIYQLFCLFIRFISFLIKIHHWRILVDIFYICLLILYNKKNYYQQTNKWITCFYHSYPIQKW